MNGVSAWDGTVARAIAEGARKGAVDFLGADGETATALLPIFHALQERFGYIDRAALPLLADVLNISKAEVHGALSFYHDFRDAPAGDHVLRLCRAEACQAMGSERLADHAHRRHGLAPGHTSADGAITFETVYCLGNCALSPCALLDNEVIGRLDEAALDALIESARRNRA